MTGAPPDGSPRDRDERVAFNEALFREVNERIHQVNAGFATAASALQILCECGDATCTVQLQLPAGAYEEVRAHPARFALAPGHLDPTVERLVGTGDGYEVVEKLEPTARIARATDPRS